MARDVIYGIRFITTLLIIWILICTVMYSASSSVYVITMMSVGGLLSPACIMISFIVADILEKRNKQSDC